MSSSDETHSSQQLQHQRLGSVTALQLSYGYGRTWTNETLPPPGRRHSPGILVVEAQCDLVDAARVGHNQVEARLKDLNEDALFGPQVRMPEKIYLMIIKAPVCKI